MQLGEAERDGALTCERRAVVASTRAAGSRGERCSSRRANLSAASQPLAREGQQASDGAQECAAAAADGATCARRRGRRGAQLESQVLQRAL